jgi:hypothetical protein
MRAVLSRSHSCRGGSLLIRFAVILAAIRSYDDSSDSVAPGRSPNAASVSSYA